MIIPWSDKLLQKVCAQLGIITASYQQIASVRVTLEVDQVMPTGIQ